MGSYGGGNITGYFLWSNAGGTTNIGYSGVEFNNAPSSQNQLVGTEWVGINQSYAVVRNEDGTLSRLNYLHPSDAMASVLAVSDTGTAIGYSASNSSGQPVLWNLSTGTAVQIGTSGLNEGVDNAVISNSGYAAWTNLQVVVHQEGYPGPHTEMLFSTFLRDPSGTVTELNPTPSANCPHVVDIADSGRVLISDAFNNSWLWNPGSALTPVALNSVFAMNGAGQILGSIDGRSVVLDTNGTLSNLPLPDGARSARVADINDNGVVVGWAEFTDPNDVRAVLWAPVPEPSALAALSCGIFWMLTGVIRRRSS